MVVSLFMNLTPMSSVYNIGSRFLSPTSGKWVTVSGHTTTASGIVYVDAQYDDCDQKYQDRLEHEVWLLSWLNGQGAEITRG